MNTSTQGDFPSGNPCSDHATDHATDDPTAGPTRRRRGPAPKLTREQIAIAVLEVGFENLTIASVARHLRVAPGGLYRYVKDRDDLVLAAIDQAFLAMPVSCASDWQTMLEEEVWARWDVLVKHPGLIAALRTTGTSAPEISRRYRLVAETVVSFGLSPVDAILVVDAVIDLVNDGSQQYAAMVSIVERGDSPDFVERQHRNLGPQFGDVMEEILIDPRAFFARKLKATILGLEEITKSPP